MIWLPESVRSLPISTPEAKAITLTTIGGMCLGASVISLFKMKEWKSGALMGTYLGLVVGIIDMLSNKVFDELECYNDERDKCVCKGIFDASVTWLAARIVSRRFAVNLDHYVMAFFLLYITKKRSTAIFK